MCPLITPFPSVYGRCLGQGRRRLDRVSLDNAPNRGKGAQGGTTISNVLHIRAATGILISHAYLFARQPAGRRDPAPTSPPQV